MLPTSFGILPACHRTPHGTETVLLFFFFSNQRAGESRSLEDPGSICFRFSVFYIVAIALLGYHLKHGFVSAGQTLGIKGTKYEKTYLSIASLFWLWIPLGFISMPLWFGFVYNPVILP